MRKIIMIIALLLLTLLHGYMQSEYHYLSGVVIVLDAGHGGRDKGASFNGLNEAQLNLNIVLKLKQYLVNSGAKVILTRNKDNDLSHQDAANHKQSDLNNRIKIMNEDKVDLVISIHQNALDQSNVWGSQVFYNYDDKLARCFDECLKEVTKAKFKIKVGDYFLLNNCHKPMVLVECGFLSNLAEAKLLQDENYQEQLAKQMYKAILNYYDYLI